MPIEWIPDATRLGSGTIGGAMDHPAYPARVVWHTTESGSGDASFDSIGSYLTSIGSEPQVLYDPTTDRIGQYGPLTKSARALKNSGNTRNNRVGAACIQIGVLARASQPFTDYWRPGPNFRALMVAIHSFDIPDIFPMGPPARSVAGCRRDAAIWMKTGGHYGHCNVPGNDRWDPGGIDLAALFGVSHSGAPQSISTPTTTGFGWSG